MSVANSYSTSNERLNNCYKYLHDTFKLEGNKSIRPFFSRYKGCWKNLICIDIIWTSTLLKCYNVFGSKKMHWEFLKNIHW